MTQEIVKAPTDAKVALAQAVDQSTGLDLMTLSTVMVQSGFFPNAESVAQGVVKILAGRELGFPAIASMRHIYVHNGHIGLQATLIATQIRRSGTYDYRIVESTDAKCSIEFQRKRDGEWVSEGTASFTIEEAQRAKLVKTGSGWENYPSDMLFARAITRGQRRYCPDVFGQAVYSEEEVREIAAAEPTNITPRTPEDMAAELMPREKKALIDPADPVVVDKALEVAEVMAGPPPEGIKSGLAGAEAMMRETDAVIIDAMKSGSAPGQEPPVQETPPSTEREQPLITQAEIETLTEIRDRAQASPPQKTTFTVGSQVFETNGINRAQMMELFKLYPRVAKKYGQEKAAAVLKNEFHLEHRDGLTEEQAERYTIRLREMLEG